MYRRSFCSEIQIQSKLPFNLKCPTIPIAVGCPSITLPGGAELSCVFPSVIPPSPAEAIRALLGQLNAALAPLEPLFDILDAILAIYEMIKSLSTLNPAKIKEGLEDLAKALAQLAVLFPPISLVATVADMIEVVARFLLGLTIEIQAQIDYTNRIIQAETMLSRTGAQALQGAIDCAKGLQLQYVVSLNEGMRPIATIFGIINAFLEIIGLGEFSIPTIGATDVPGLADFLEVIQEVAEVMLEIRAYIPV